MQRQAFTIFADCFQFHLVEDHLTRQKTNRSSMVMSMLGYVVYKVFEIPRALE